MTVRISALLLACALVASAATGARAQSADAWKVTVVPYMMGAAMSGTTGVAGQEVTVDMSASDIFSNLQFGAMGMVVARKGSWGGGGDAQVYTEIGGFGVGSTFTWQVFPALGFSLSKRASLELGDRWLDIDYETGENTTLFKYDVLTQGPIVGFAFRF